MTYQFLREDGSPTQEATALDALWEAQTSTVVWVEDSEILWKADASRTLHEFAIWCAEEVLKTVEDPDPISLEALRIKKLWIDGKATDEDLTNARRAARPGACNAAWSAAWPTAWHAAYGAAWDASQNATWNAAWESQNRELERRLEALRPSPVRRSRWEALLDDDPV